MASLADKHKDPKRFWSQLKQLSGHTTGPDTYLIDENGQRHYSNEDKERLLTLKWKRVFQDNDDKDFNDNDTVLDFLGANGHRASPYNEADPSRLLGDSPLSCLISSEELKAAIRSIKSTCPGGSKINKTIIANLPDCALGRLRCILTAALSAGYFPGSFKGAEMRMIVKPGKVPT